MERKSKSRSVRTCAKRQTRRSLANAHRYLRSSCSLGEPVGCGSNNAVGKARQFAKDVAVLLNSHGCSLKTGTKVFRLCILQSLQSQVFRLCILQSHRDVAVLLNSHECSLKTGTKSFDSVFFRAIGTCCGAERFGAGFGSRDDSGGQGMLGPPVTLSSTETLPVTTPEIRVRPCIWNLWTLHHACNWRERLKFVA